MTREAPGTALSRAGRLSASLMCADFGQLQEQLAALRRGGVHSLHLDFGDGHFVPNLPLGLEVFDQLPSRQAWHRECHLMIDGPLPLLPLFLPRTDLLIFHLEATDEPEACLRAIRGAGVAAGVALKPASPAQALRPLVEQLDAILVMAVEPGFSGAEMVSGVAEKIGRLRAIADESRPGIIIEVDGAVSRDNVAALARAGADRFVGGSSGLFLGPESDLEGSARELGASIQATVPEGDRLAARWAPA